MTAFLLGFVLGLLFWLGYKVFRCLRASGWDSSNVLNVLRADSFLAVHPEVYPYLVDSRKLKSAVLEKDGLKAWKLAYVFHYLPDDEFKEVVETVEDK